MSTELHHLIATKTTDAELRHFVRDRLAALRNAACYLQRRVEPTPLWAEDQRVPQFFALMIRELAAIEGALGGPAGVPTSLRADQVTAKLAVRVLVVDDHDGNRGTLSALLTDEGFFVDDVGTFVGACARLQEAAPYDVVVLERRVEDKDGLELVPRARAVEPSTRIIVVDAADGTLAGVDAVVRKDRGYDVLRACMGELLARS